MLRQTKIDLKKGAAYVNILLGKPIWGISVCMGLFAKWPEIRVRDSMLSRRTGNFPEEYLLVKLGITCLEDCNDGQEYFTAERTDSVC